MKMKYFVLLITIFASLNVFADFMSERDAVTKFEKEEFTNPKNYPTPPTPGTVVDVNKKFAEQVTANPTKLKYFLFLSIKYRMMEAYDKDRAFALNLNNKFKTNKLSAEQKTKVLRTLGQYVFDDSNTDHKKAMSSRQATDDYYKKMITKLNSASF